MSNELISYDVLEKMSKALGINKMFGKTPQELLPLMLIAQAEGKHPAIAAQEYDIINGRPAINSKASLARFQAAGGKIAWIERSDEKVSAKFAHQQGGELIVTWDKSRAEKAGLMGKDNWKKFPAQMLSARVIAEGVRAVYPACLSGMYTSEEVQDFTPDTKPTTEEPRNVTPEKVEKPAQKIAPSQNPLYQELRGTVLSQIAAIVKTEDSQDGWTKGEKEVLEIKKLITDSKDTEDFDKLNTALLRAQTYQAVRDKGGEVMAATAQAILECETLEQLQALHQEITGGLAG